MFGPGVPLGPSVLLRPVKSDISPFHRHVSHENLPLLTDFHNFITEPRKKISPAK
jgi:hypothetical protein